MSRLIGVIACVIGTVALLLGLSVMTTVFASYKDSEDSAYLIVGTPLVIFGLVGLYGGVTVIRRGRV